MKRFHFSGSRLPLITGIIFSCIIAAADNISYDMPVLEMSQGYTGKYTWGMFTTKSKLEEFPALQAALPNYSPDHTVEVIRYITPGGIGEKEGLQTGDILIETSPYSSVTSRPGDPITLKVWFPAENTVREIATVMPQYYQIKFEPYTEPAGAAEFAVLPFPDREIYGSFLEQEPLKTNFADLRQRLTDIDSLVDAYRLPVFRYLIRNPFRLEQVSRSWTGKISAVKDWHELLPLGRYMLEFSAPEVSDPAAEWLQNHPLPGEDASAEEIVNFYIDILRRCKELHQHAWSGISAEEMEFVRRNRHNALESICRYHMLSYDSDTESVYRTLEVFSILNRIDQPALFEQAQTAALLGNKTLLDRLQNIFAGGRGILYKQESDAGTVIICGGGNDYHTANAALLIDLGGSDIYLNNQATPVPGNFSTSVFIDCGGDDYYSSTDGTGQGCGDLGVGILIDLAGNDTYTGIEMMQGSSFGGIGVLYDAAGNDTAVPALEPELPPPPPPPLLCGFFG